MQKTCPHCSTVTHNLLSISGLSNNCMKFLSKGLGPLHTPLNSSAEESALAGGMCIRSRSSHIARQNICAKSSPTGYLLGHLMKKTSELLLLGQK